MRNVILNAFYGSKDKFSEADKFALAGSPLKNGAGETFAAENESLKKLMGELTVANDYLSKRRYDAVMIYTLFRLDLGSSYPPTF